MYASGSNCVCVCVYVGERDLELSVCNCGKAFVHYKRGKLKHQLQINLHFVIAVTANAPQAAWSFCGDARSWCGKYPKRKGLSACVQHKQHI